MTRLLEVEPSLALFVEGIAGRYLHIKSIEEFSGAAAFIGNSGQSSDALYLPTELPPHYSASAYRVLALQQIGQRLHGTYRFRLDRALELLPHRAAMPPAASAASLRQGDLQAWYQRYEYPGLAAQLFRLFETARVEATVLRDLPGIKKHFRHLFVTNDSAAPASAQVSLFDEAARCVRYQLSDESHTFYTDIANDKLWSALLVPLDQIVNDARNGHPEQSVYQSVLATDTCYEKLVALVASSDLTDAEEPVETHEDWTQRDVRLEDWEDELAQLNQQLMAAQVMEEAEIDAADASAEGGDIKPEEVSIQQIVEQRDTLSRRVDMERSAIRHALGPPHPNTRSYLYEEWDYQQRRYLNAHCRLYEERLEPGDDETELANAMAVIQRWQPEIKSRLAHIKPLGYQRQPRVEDGDELDFNALLQARLDLRTGISPDERIYSRRERMRRDLGAAFLVDLSASTDDPLEKPEPEPFDEDEYDNLRDPHLDFDLKPDTETPRRIIDVQREAMLVMASALESLGDDHGIFGFSGYGRECVEFYVAKELGEAFGTQTLRAIGAMQPKRSTRMGPAIRHATRKLVAAGYVQKLMLILSDGFPQDCDYGPDRGEHEYGVQDTAKALQEAEAKGIDTFCVTVDRSGHDYLKRMCPSANYLIIDEVEDLPAALTKVYQALSGR